MRLQHARRQPRGRAALVGMLVAGLTGACGPGKDEAPASRAATASATSAAPAFDDVVLVTFDTLRADHLPSYGYPRATAPFFARLASEGVLFENALASVSHTAPSHATMLTGLPPRVHGVRRNGNKLPAALPTLPRLLAQRGFASAAFLGAQFLSGIAQDFGHVTRKASATTELVDEALAWVAAQGEQPTFLWLHLYDPHRWKHPKVPSWARDAVATGSVSARSVADAEPFFEQLARRHGYPPAGESGELPWLGSDGKGGTHAARARDEVLRAIDDYDALIRFADAEVERLYEALARARPERRSLWILTCDHGEGLGSHGYEGHGGRIYNEQLRVGLLFHASDGSLAPRREAALVGHMDLLPTLAELCGLAWRPPHAEFFGRSLVPLLSGPADFPARLHFGEQRRAEDAEAGDAGEMVAIQDALHKLIRYPDGSEEYFALGQDPLELQALAVEDARRAELRAALEERLRFFAGLGTAELTEPAPEFLDELQALGYAR